MVTGLSGVINKNPTDLFCSYWYRLSLGNLWNGTSFLHRKSWNNEPSHQNFSKRIYILVESPISRYFRSSCKLLVLGSSVAACRSLKLQSYPQKSTHHPCKRNPHHLHWVNHWNHSWIPSSIGCISAVDLWRCLGYSGLHPYTFFEGIQYPLSFPVTTFDAVTGVPDGAARQNTRSSGWIWASWKKKKTLAK